MTLTPEEIAAFDAAPAAGGGEGSDNPPPVGWEGVVTVTTANQSARKRDGRKFAKVQVQSGEYQWSAVFKWLSEDGTSAISPRHVTSLRIALEPWGLYDIKGATLDAQLASLNGKQFKVQQVQDGDWVNTVVQHPVQSAPAPAPTPIGGAQFGDDVPWDQPAAPAPPQSAITGG